MNEKPDHPPAHIDPGILASLTDPAAAGWIDESVRLHLAQCRYCMAVYAEFARTRIDDALSPEGEPPPAELIAIGKAIGSHDRAARAAVGNSGAADNLRAATARVVAGDFTPGPASAGVASIARRRWALAAMGAVAAMIGLAFWVAGWRQHDARRDHALQQRLAEVLRQDSNGGLLYSASEAPSERRVRGAGSDPVAAGLDSLASAFAAAPRSDDAYWLVAGLLATNRIREADLYLETARQRFPNEVRFVNLAAILAYKRSELGDAEAALRAALERSRSPVQLFNLARVLQETGHGAEADRLLAELLQRFPDAPIAALARAHIGRSEPAR